MKKTIFLSISLFSICLSAQEESQKILCTGTANDGALLEIELDLNASKKSIIVDQQPINLSANNDFTVSWTTTVQGIRYNSFLSKITGDMIVVAIDEERSASSIRANLSCIKKENRLFQ
mgnify:CR=1 FL=1|jgi:hypothetical protein